MAFNIDKIEINAAFYEIFEAVFNEDFFVIMGSLRRSPRITRLSEANPEDLTEDDKEELLDANVKLGTKMRKYAPRIAYVGYKLYKKQYNGSYTDYLSFLAENDVNEFMNPETIKKLWEKINLDQRVPESAKNA